MTTNHPTLPGIPNNAPLTQRIFVKRITATYQKTIVREDAPIWAAAPRFTHPNLVKEWFSWLAEECKEHFITLHLDGKNKILCFDPVSTGSLNQSIVHPREVFKTAMLSSAAAIILIHNHPSGDTTPSNEDKQITTRLKEAGDILGVKVLDHIIIGSEGYYSFVENHLI